MNKTKKTCIIFFILLNLLGMIRIHLPLDAKYFSSIYRQVDKYLSFFSIYQDWMMFAKDPSRVSIYMTADIEFDDGTKDTYTFPNPMEMSLSQKYVSGERFRKIISEAIRRDDHRFMWEDVAKFALRKVKDKHYSKIPMKVHLVRHWYETPDVQSRFIPHKSKSQNFNKFTFYTHEVI